MKSNKEQYIQNLKDLVSGVYDPVNRPFHYNWLKKEVIDIIKDCLTEEEFKGYLKGNIIKYSLRAGLKANSSLEEDLQKRNKYLQWLKEIENKKHPEDCLCPDCRYLHG